VVTTRVLFESLFIKGFKTMINILRKRKQLRGLKNVLQELFTEVLKPIKMKFSSYELNGFRVFLKMIFVQLFCNNF